MKVWIAKDSDGDIYMYGMKPIKTDVGTFEVQSACMEVCAEHFPEITHENSPQEFELVKAKPAFDKEKITCHMPDFEKEYGTNDLRNGQTVYWSTMFHYPELSMYHFRWDCFYEDKLVDRFLDEAESVWNKLK